MTSIGKHRVHSLLSLILKWRCGIGRVVPNASDVDLDSVPWRKSLGDFTKDQRFSPININNKTNKNDIIAVIYII